MSEVVHMNAETPHTERRRILCPCGVHAITRKTEDIDSNRTITRWECSACGKKGEHLHNKIEVASRVECLEHVESTSVSLCECGSKNMDRIVVRGGWRWRCTKCQRQYESITPPPLPIEPLDLPLPIIHTDFVLNIKDIEEARQAISKLEPYVNNEGYTPITLNGKPLREGDLK